MESAIDQSGAPNLQRLFRAARDFTTKRHELFSESAVAKVLDTDPEKVIKAIDAAGGPTAIKRVREAILGPPTTMQTVNALKASPTSIPGEAFAAWDAVRRHIMEGVCDRARDKSAKGLQGEILSGAKLETELTRIGRESLQELLTPLEIKALDNITTVAKAIRSSERFAATGFTSVTGQVVGLMTIFGGPGAAAGSATGIPGGEFIGGVMSLLLAPIPAARMLTNPTVAKFVASPRFGAWVRGIERTGQLTGEGVRTLARLGGILAAEGMNVKERTPAEGRAR